MVTIKQQLVSSMAMANGTGNRGAYITIHETANMSPGANAQAHANLQSRLWNWASWHYTVDSIQAIQSYAHNRQLRHAGDGPYGTGNAQSIGIEVCINADGNNATARRHAAELTAYLLKHPSIEASTLDRVVQHNRWSSENKNCPTLMRANGGRLWNEFLSMVRTALNDDPREEVNDMPTGRINFRYTPSQRQLVKLGTTETVARSANGNGGLITENGGKLLPPGIHDFTLNLELQGAPDTRVQLTLERGKTVAGKWNYIRREKRIKDTIDSYGQAMVELSHAHRLNKDEVWRLRLSTGSPKHLETTPIQVIEFSGFGLYW